MKPDEQCEAVVSRPWSSPGCSRRFREARLDHRVCAQHAAMFDKWREERGLETATSMARLYWHWRTAS